MRNSMSRLCRGFFPEWTVTGEWRVIAFPIQKSLYVERSPAAAGVPTMKLNSAARGW